MKIKALWTLAVGLSLFGMGCWQKSVHPFFREKDVRFEPGLVGTWKETKGKPDGTKDEQVWTFSRGREKIYRLEVQDGESKREYDAQLFALGGARFLDLYSRTRAVSEIPAHHLFRVGKIDGSLQLRILNGEWMMKWVTAHPSGIPHVRVPDPDHPDDPDKGEIVLTAATEVLQKFVLEHLDEKEFFDEPGELKKTENP